MTTVVKAKRKKTDPKAKTPVSQPVATPVLTDAQAFQNAKDEFDKATEVGRGYGDKYFADGSMGRISEDISPGEVSALDELKRLHEASLQRDPTAQLVLDKMTGGLEGYNAPENQGLREQMAQENDRNYKTASSQLQQQAAASRVRGRVMGALQENLNTNFTQARAGQERDLLVANVAEKQRRLQALSDYQLNLNQQENANRNSTANSWATGEQNRGMRQLLGQQYNQGQSNAEKAGRIGSELGVAGTITGLAGTNKSGSIDQNTTDRVMQMIQQSMKDAAAANNQYLQNIGKFA